MSAITKRTSGTSFTTQSIPDAGPQKWTPEPYQLKACSWLLKHYCAGLFLDPGLGKTSISLAAIKTLRRTGEMPKDQGMLVIAPLRPVYNVWDGSNPDSEPRKWSDFNGLRTAVLHGPEKDQRLGQPADAYIMNPDGLGWLEEAIRRRKRFPFYGLVVDESTDFKHANTVRFGLLKSMLRKFQRRWILTGTPAPNGLLDLFGQIYILDLGNALGPYITHYKRTYFTPLGFGYGGYGTVALQEGAEEKIYKRIEPLILRMSEQDYLKLPRLVGAIGHRDTKPSLVKIKLPAKARAAYDQLEELFFADLEDGSITASNAGVKTIKLRQVTNGGIYLDKGGEEADRRGLRKWSLVHEAKSEAVAELLEELSGRGAAIAFEFHHDLERMRRHSELKNIPAIGEGSIKDDVLLARDLNSGKLKGVFVNPASFSRGSNMQAGADALIWHSMTYNWEHYNQLIRRFWRKGRTRPFFVYHVIAEDTVDLAMIHALRSKIRTERGLLDALRAYSFRRPRR